MAVLPPPDSPNPFAPPRANVRVALRALVARMVASGFPATPAPGPLGFVSAVMPALACNRRCARHGGAIGFRRPRTAPLPGTIADRCPNVLEAAE